MLKIMHKLRAIVALSYLVLNASNLYSEEIYPAHYEEFSAENPYNTCCTNFPLDIRLSYTSAEGIGRKEGYTTLALSTCPSSQCGCLNPFLDFRLHYLDNGRLAGNFGVGFQIHNNEQQLRGYVFYDFRDTSFRLLNQITVGADWHSSYLDLRLNTYWPTQDSGHADIDRYLYSNDQVATRYSNIRAWKGVEFDASKNFFLFNFDIYTTLGAYVFYGHRHHNSAIGGKIRLETDIRSNLSLAIQYSYDRRFESRFYGQISWTLPFSNSCCCETTCCNPILREEIIVIDRTCHWKTNY
jgi:hypothetical protein